MSMTEGARANITMSVSVSEMYKEIGENYRDQLHWREKLFAGFLAVLAALAVAFYHTYPASKNGWNRFAWIVLLVGFLLALVFLAADNRCAQGIRHIRKCGKELEAPLKGVYTMTVELAPKTFFEHLTTHTWVLRLLYGFTAIFLFIATIVLLGATGGDERGVTGGEAMSELNQMAIVFAIYNLIIALIGLAVVNLGYRLLCHLFTEEDVRKKVVSDGWGAFFKRGVVALSIPFVVLGFFMIIGSLRGCVVGIDLSDMLHKSFPAVTSSQQTQLPSKVTP